MQNNGKVALEADEETIAKIEQLARENGITAEEMLERMLDEYEHQQP